MNEKIDEIKGSPFMPADIVDYSAGSVVSKTLIKNESGNITLFSFDRGQGLSEHTAPFDATVFILDGKAEITIGGEPHHLHTGQMLIMPAGVPHALHAEERFKMMLIMVAAPA